MITESSLHMIVKGRVQGVGFRWFVAEEARKLGLAGWVMNTRDGAVEIEASGEGTALATLEKAVAKGPKGAQVSGVATLPRSSHDRLAKPFAIK